MKTAIEFVLLAAKKAGIEPTDPRLAALNENKALAGIAVDDEVFSAVDAELISFTEAKQHPLITSAISGKVKSEALDTFDKQIIPKILKDLAIEDSEVADILAEKSTYNKMEMLTKKMYELSAAKAKASTTGDKAELVKQIDALNKLVNDTKAQFDAEKSKLSEAHNSDIYDFALTSKLSGKNFTLKDAGNDVNLLTSKTIINSELQAKGAKAVFDKATNSFKLVNAANPELPYYENNKSVDFDTFADRVLLEKKVVSPNSPTPPAPPRSGGNPPTPTPLTGGNMNSYLEKLESRKAGV